MHPDNLFEDIPKPMPEEVTDTLLAADGVRIERIVSHGQASPDGFWYDQDEHEWVLLLAGEACLQIDGEKHARTLKPGDFLLLPAGQRHRVARTAADGDTIWLAVFFR
ncbi:MAG: cupin domain-containing protein [Mariprofundaceae bacterium]